MKKIRKLRWGETPFDRMSHADLLIHAKRIYMSLKSTHTILATSKSFDEFVSKKPLPYWGKDGSGGKALDQAKRSLGKIERGYDKEDIYRMFFRYAGDVLFDTDKTARRWQVCDHCKCFLGTVETVCTFCGNKMRELTMTDLTSEPKS